MANQVQDQITEEEAAAAKRQAELDAAAEAEALALFTCESSMARRPSH
jgi:hypothetical protein